MLDIQVEGMPELSDKLTAAANVVADDLEPVFVSIGELLKAFYETEPFLSQGGVYGTKWANLKPASLKAKERKYKMNRGVLIASGTMMNSFMAVPTPMSVTLMNTSRLFPYHQLGTTKMPQRVMMKLDEARQQMVIDLVDTRVGELIAEAFNEGT